MRSNRLAAAAGVLGPGFFVAMWATLGATRPGYSAVEDAISQLARIATSTRPAMTVGFVGYGLALCGYAADAPLPRTSRVLVAGTGVATLGVAAFPLGGVSDTVHAGFAGIGYATLAAAPLFAARSFARCGRRRWARYSVSAGAVCAICLIASLAGPAHGLLQRAGLTVGDAWIVASACRAWASST